MADAAGHPQRRLRARRDSAGIGAIRPAAAPARPDAIDCRAPAPRPAGPPRVAVSRPLLTRIAHDAGGNPLMAIELARAVLRLLELPKPGDDLPVAASVQQLLADTVNRLPPDTRHAVRLTALLTSPNPAGPRVAGVHEPDSCDQAGTLGPPPTGHARVRPAHRTPLLRRAMKEASRAHSENSDAGGVRRNAGSSREGYVLVGIPGAVPRSCWGEFVRKCIAVSALVIGVVVAGSGVAFASPVSPSPAASGSAPPAANGPAARPGGPSLPAPVRRVSPAAAVNFSVTGADCDAVIATARAARQRQAPASCTDARLITDIRPGKAFPGATTPSAVTWPSACSTSATPSGTWWAIDRRDACNHTSFEIITKQVPSGKVIGTTNIHAISTMIASTTMARWVSSTRVWVWNWTGVGSPDGSTGKSFGSCTGCIGTGGSYRQLNFDAWSGNGNVDVNGLTVGKIVTVNGFWELTFTGKAWGNPVTVKAGIAPSRCDNAFSGNGRPAGCVLPGIPGDVGFSQKAVPWFVYHVYSAQLSGLPGRLGTSSYLTRLTDPKLRDANGNRACPSRGLTRPIGDECDEYPFRSTYQGAYTSKATTARSFPSCQMPDPKRTGPTGWSRCFIPATQNKSAGGTLGNFYAAQRMLDKDPFQIGYLP